MSSRIHVFTVDYDGATQAMLLSGFVLYALLLATLRNLIYTLALRYAKQHAQVWQQPVVDPRNIYALTHEIQVPISIKQCS
jgi:hypothetical protein